MSDAAAIIGIGLLIIGGILAASSTQGELLNFEETNYVQDQFPYKADWGANGSISSSLTETNGNLVISNDELNNTDPQGKFESNVFQKKDGWQFTKITATASELKKIGSNQTKINLTVYGLGNNDAIVTSKKLDLNSEKVSYDTTNLTEDQVTGYRFKAVLYGQGDISTSPKLENVSIAGNQVDETSGSDYPVNLTTILIVVICLGAFILKNR